MLGNAIFLSCNVEGYTAGNYHQDLIDAVKKLFNCFLYGPGIPSIRSEPYPKYDAQDTIDDVIRKSPWNRSELDLIICGTHWDAPGQTNINNQVDPHPNINLSAVECPKIYFINKEYINLEQKLEFARNNEIDLIITVLPESVFRHWSVLPKTKVVQSHFGINTDLFEYDSSLNRRYDLSFTGSLHEKYSSKRREMKDAIFRYPNLPTNIGPTAALIPGPVISKDFKHLRIYWAEWNKRWSRGWNGKTLLPSGAAYAKLMRDSSLFFNTLSASGIFGTRFFEVMASGAVNFCPVDDYYGILKDGVNCVMYSDVSEASEKVDWILKSPKLRAKIVKNGRETARSANYSSRLKMLLTYLDTEGRAPN